MFLARKWAAGLCVFGMCGACAFGQAAYTNVITGNTTEDWGLDSNWVPTGIPGFFLTNLTEGVGDSNDIARVEFEAGGNVTRTPQIDLQGTGYVLSALQITEGGDGQRGWQFHLVGWRREPDPPAHRLHVGWPADRFPQRDHDQGLG